jgi:hypothetical protein
MTEIFVEDDTFLENEDEETQNKTIEERIQDVTDAMSKSIRQPVRCSCCHDGVTSNKVQFNTDISCFTLTGCAS